MQNRANLDQRFGRIQVFIETYAGTIFEWQYKHTVIKLTGATAALFRGFDQLKKDVTAIPGGRDKHHTSDAAIPPNTSHNSRL